MNLDYFICKMELHFLADFSERTVFYNVSKAPIAEPGT